MITVPLLMQRVDEQILVQLTDENGAVVDELKCEHALSDAWAEIQGYIYDLPANRVPPETALDSHQFNITMYRLAGNRSGTEFESYAKRYDATIKFLDKLSKRYAPKPAGNAGGVMAVGEERTPIFDEASLAEMGSMEVDS